MDRIFESFNGLTQFSIVLISIVGLLFHVKWSRRSTALGPTILTTMGIFFCFAGIAWGLLDFNPNDVRNSVPHLLQGVRTSFWSSVVGIFWALTLKIRVALWGDASVRTDEEEGSTVDDLARLLVQLNESIAGADDSALLSQFKLLRADSNARIDGLKEAFDGYAKNITEANARALVSSLSQVVRDFNVKLNDQFGDNFKQLDAGVEKLVAWQIQYEKQLNALIRQEAVTRDSMKEATLRFTEIVNAASEFTAVARSLQDIVGAVNNQSEQLAPALLVLSGLIREVAEGLPIIEQRLVQLFDGSEPEGRAKHKTLGAVSRHATESLQPTRA